MNKLPKNWILTTIGEVGIVVSGGTPSTKKSEYWEGGNISWITPADLSKYNEKNISKGKRNITQEGLDYSSAKLLPKGTVLFSSRAPIGYTVIAKNELATNQGFKNLITTKSLSSDYVYYYFKTLKKLAEEVASGTTFLELSGTKFSKLPFPLPPLSEQNSISLKIENLFNTFTLIEEDLNNTLLKLKGYKYLISKNILSEKDDWKTLEVDELFDLIDGDRGKNYPKKDDYLNEGYCLFLSTKNVRKNNFKFDENNFISKEKSHELRRGLLQRDDIVMTTRGTLGNIALYDSSIPYDNIRINSSMIILRNKKESISLPYMLQYMTSNFFQEQIRDKYTGTAQPQLPSKILKKLLISYPSYEKQIEIEQELKYHFSQIDNLKTTIETAVKEIDILRIKTLDNAFKGKLVDNIIDESAKDLLKQIQSEKLEYLKQEKKIQKKRVKKGRTMSSNLSILEILEKATEPILAKKLWQQSKHKDDIEAFYSELKSIEDRIEIESKNRDSFIRIKNANK